MLRLRFLLPLILGVAVTAVLVPASRGADSWTYDGITYRLPVGKEAPVLPADVPEYHIVVPGDCLWNLAGHYLGDPFFWPLIWEINLDTIANPHLIYPGQKILLPHGTGGAVIPGTGGPGTMAGTPGAGGPGTGGPGSGLPSGGSLGGQAMDAMDMEMGITVEPEAAPATERSTLIKGGYISDERPREPRIVGAETFGRTLSTRDVVYINTGSDDGVKAGDRFYVLAPDHQIRHPETGRNMGWLIKIPGVIKVLCVQAEASTAEIVESFDLIEREMVLTPYYPIEMPMTYGAPEIEDCNASTGEIPGHIIDTYNGAERLSDATIMGQGTLVYVDIGSTDGVVAGDYFTIWRKDEGSPKGFRYLAGVLILLRVEEETSSAMITSSRGPTFLGNAQIELMK